MILWCLGQKIARIQGNRAIINKKVFNQCFAYWSLPSLAALIIASDA